MWLFLNDAMLSVVNDPQQPRNLLVRARRAGEIDRTFPGAKVQTTKARDYRFRASIPRIRVGDVLAAKVARIDYGNFKASVKDESRHDAYLRVWQAMANYQREHAPEPKPPPRGRASHYLLDGFEEYGSGSTGDAGWTGPTHRKPVGR